MVINASAAVKHYQNRDLKKIQALSEIRTHDLCDAGAVLSQPTELSKPHESGRIRVSPLYGDVLTWPKYSKDESNLSHSSD